MVVRGALALTGILAISSLALPIFTRHDVPVERYLQRAKAPEFACVGSISIRGNQKGSCVLVSPSWALTDAHVVKGIPLEDIEADFGGSRSRISRIVIHPDYESERLKLEPTGLGKKGVDLALIRLKDPATATPARIARKPLAVGTEIAVAGFGVLGRGDSLNTTQEAVRPKRAGTNVVDSIGGNIEGAIPDLYYVTDFDAPAGGASNRCGSPTPTDLECLGTGGDSGGGAFAKAATGWELVGLFATSRYFDGPSAYGCVGMYTRVDRFAAWIDRQIVPR